VEAAFNRDWMDSAVPPLLDADGEDVVGGPSRPASKGRSQAQAAAIVTAPGGSSGI